MFEISDKLIITWSPIMRCQRSRLRGERRILSSFTALLLFLRPSLEVTGYGACKKKKSGAGGI